MKQQTQKKLRLFLQYGYEREFGYSYCDVRDQNDTWQARIWNLTGGRYGVEFVQHAFPTQLEMTVHTDSFGDAAWSVLQLLNALEVVKEKTGKEIVTVRDLPDDVRKHFFGDRPNYRLRRYIADDRKNEYLDLRAYAPDAVAWA
ncbi:MAG: hypothetical protein II835_14490 [Fibrobacter sp.]|nr:hypothetical protein [Fibrobacter sp.]